MIQSLHAFRGFFAILIFIHHYNLYGTSNHIGGGTSSVVFFFILSGFVISSGYQEKFLNSPRSISAKDFIIRRVEKIYPLHIFCGLMWLFALGTLDPRQVKMFLCNVLLVQSWIPNKDYYFSCNGVSWYISSLLFCYIVYPFFVQIVQFTKRNNIFVVCASVVAMLIIYSLIVVSVSKEATHAVVYIHPLMRIIDFFWGVLLWNLLSSSRNHRNISYRMSSRKAAFVQLMALIVMGCFFVVYNNVDLPERLTLVSYWWIPCVLLIATFYLLDDSETFINRFLKMRCVQRFADLSFSFFMIHQIFITCIIHRAC